MSSRRTLDCDGGASMPHSSGLSADVPSDEMRSTYQTVSKKILSSIPHDSGFTMKQWLRSEPEPEFFYRSPDSHRSSSYPAYEDLKLRDHHNASIARDGPQGGRRKLLGHKRLDTDLAGIGSCFDDPNRTVSKDDLQYAVKGLTRAMKEACQAMDRLTGVMEDIGLEPRCLSVH